MVEQMKFTRTELAGSLGDLGTLLPLSTALIVINGINPTSIFLCIGLFYILSGLYFQVTCPVEPMKVISAYAIATGITAVQIQASCFWIFVILGLIGITGLIDVISRAIRKAVIRGVQLSTGILLLTQGCNLILGKSQVQTLLGGSEPYLAVLETDFLPIGIILGTVAAILMLSLLDNKKAPAALVTLAAGTAVGIILGDHGEWSRLTLGINLPELLPFGFPSLDDLTFALLILTLPQIPMTIGNAVMANTDLSREYFGEKSRRVTNKALCLSMALASLCSFAVAGIPLCHGAGGLASRYRFGARTAGSNMIIGSVFLLSALFLGTQLLFFIHLIPFSVLGVLLVFAGLQLSLAILDVKVRKDLFVVIMILGITLTVNLAIGFLIGIILDHLLKWEKLSV